MRIIFMGTPDFAVPALHAIVQSKHLVVGVVTAPDRPAGRGKKLKTSAVKDYALEHGLPIYQPTQLKSPDFVRTIQELKPDLAVVIAFRMLPKIIWSIPSRGTFNIHGSLLPAFRGAAPIQWAIIRGETKTGLTSFFIDEKLDTGAIIDRMETAIGPEETAGDLHDRLMLMSAELTLRTLDAIESGSAQPRPQKEIENPLLREAPKLNRENTQIQAHRSSAENTRNLIRGLSPYPGAYGIYSPQDNAKGADSATETYLIKIFKAVHVDAASTEGSLPGDLFITDAQIILQCIDGPLKILELQLPGKKRMEAAALLKGWRMRGIFSPVINNSL